MKEAVARLNRAAKNAEETLGWLANHEDAGSIPVWEAQAEYEEDAKAILEAADHIETLEARVATLSADYDDAVKVIQEIAEQPERYTSPDGSISYSIGYAFHIVKCRAGSFMKEHAAREASR